MSNLTIFGQPAEGNFVRRESRLKDRMGGGGNTMRRIKLSNGRDFTRVVNGEEIGKPVEKQLDVIIVSWLNEPSRKFYAGAYDQNAKGKLPDCWSNNGDKPEPSASNPQSDSCLSCPQNVKGSAEGDKKACRYERRLAVLVAGDPSGQVYQIAIPAASLFSDNDGNDVYGFEGYRKYLFANNEAPDTVVTSIIYDRKAPTIKVGFKATRFLTAEEADLVDAAQDNPTTERYTLLTAAAVDGAKALPPAAKPVAAIAAAPATPPSNPFGDDEEEEEVPVKRAVKKETITSAPKPELKEALGAWLDDDED